MAAIDLSDQFEASITWLDDEPMLPGRAYVIEHVSGRAVAIVTPLKYVVAPDGRHLPAEQLDRGASGVCEIELEHPIEFLPYEQDAARGSFSLCDRVSGVRVGTGTIHFSLRRAANVRWHETAVDKGLRSEIKGHLPCVVWLTGLSGAGKSTIANLLEQQLHEIGCHTYLLDGDNVRHGLNRDLGFTPADRVENIRRVGEVAKLMVDAGLIVIASFISPYRRERRTVRELVERGEFFEVFVDAPLAAVEARDTKGLYAKARRGDLKNLTGVDAPYEVPEQPELRLDTTAATPADSAGQLLDALVAAGVVAVQSVQA